LYWKEPHQFLGGLTLVAFGAFQSKAMGFEDLLAILGPDGKADSWMNDLDDSALVKRINTALVHNGLANDLETPVGSRHQFNMCRILYLICRAAQPEIVVETGVGVGTSSAFILQALNHNRRGSLHSVERVRLAVTGLLIGDELKERWHLTIGKSYDELPKLIRDREIDIFLHDSEHSNQNMLFEYNLAWPKIRESGYLLSDDIVDNFSFFRFSSRLESDLNAVVDNFGIVRKHSKRDS
jgi:predicted O-methyltransferase YrrM